MEERSSSSRRTFLKAGAAIGTGLAASIAGCTAAMPPLGQRIRYGRVDVPEPQPATFEKWIPSPEAGDVNVATNSNYTIIYATPNELERGEQADDPGRLLCKMQLDYFGIGYREYDWILDTSHGTVIEATFDRDRVTRTVTRSGYEPSESYDGFDLFTRPDVARVVGVGDDQLLFGHYRGTDVILENLKTIVDARRGRVPRYVEVDGGIDRILESTGARPFSMLGGVQDAFQEEAKKRDMALRTDSMSIQPSGGNTYFVLKALFEQGKTPSKSEFKDLLKGKDRALEAKYVDVSVDGQIWTAEIRPKPGEIDQNRGYRYPQITWGFELEDGTLTVTHEAGVELDADNVLLTSDGIESPDDDPVISQFGESTGTVGPGTSVDIDVSKVPAPDERYDDQKKVYVVFDDGTNPHVMALYGL